MRPRFSLAPIPRLTLVVKGRVAYQKAIKHMASVTYRLLKRYSMVPVNQQTPVVTSYGSIVRVNGEVVYEYSGYIGHGPSMSCNVAEYCGAIDALTEAVKHKGIITLIGDSKLVLMQLGPDPKWGRMRPKGKVAVSQKGRKARPTKARIRRWHNRKRATDFNKKGGQC